MEIKYSFSTMLPMFKQTVRAAYRADNNSLSLSALHELADGLKDHSQDLVEESLGELVSQHNLHAFTTHGRSSMRPPSPCPLYGGRSRSAESRIRDKGVPRGALGGREGEEEMRGRRREREPPAGAMIGVAQARMSDGDGLHVSREDASEKESGMPMLVVMTDELGMKRLLGPEVWAAASARGNGRARSMSPAFWPREHCQDERKVV